jgi:hypothetical protein
MPGITWYGIAADDDGQPVYVPEQPGWQAHMPFQPTTDQTKAKRFADEGTAQDSAGVINAISSAKARAGNTPPHWAAIELPPN